MHKSTKACSIPKTVKNRVWERDHHRCIVCGDYRAFPEAHYIPRSHLGLGIEENIVTLCRKCHDKYDKTDARKWIGAIIRDYLMNQYDDWDESKLVYKKYADFEERYKTMPRISQKAVMEYKKIIKAQFEMEEQDEQNHIDRKSDE